MVEADDMWWQSSSEHNSEPSRCPAPFLGDHSIHQVVKDGLGTRLSHYHVGPLVVSCFYHPTVDTSTISSISTSHHFNHICDTFHTFQPTYPLFADPTFLLQKDGSSSLRKKWAPVAQRRSLGLRYRLCSAHFELRPSGLMPEKSIPGGEGCWSVCFLLFTNF